MPKPMLVLLLAAASMLPLAAHAQDQITVLFARNPLAPETQVLVVRHPSRPGRDALVVARETTNPHLLVRGIQGWFDSMTRHGAPTTHPVTIRYVAEDGRRSPDQQQRLMAWAARTLAELKRDPEGDAQLTFSRDELAAMLEPVRVPEWAARPGGRAP